MEPAGTVAWQCPRCTFQVRGRAEPDLLAEIRRSHEKRHRRPQR